MHALSELTHEVMELPEIQRLTLARIILETTDASFSPVGEIESEWELEIARRIALIDSGKAEGRDWETVIAQVNRSILSR